ncbi:MAG: Bug family tripartite tricarboxylate transporter substrate binding protein [Candidatus Binatia bacterium]
MAKKLYGLIVVILALVFFARTVSSATAEEFYKGKTIRFIVGFSAGGGFDTYTRMIARHFGKHVPGNPATLVENMTGAGSMIAANHIYNRAEPDGLVIGNFIGPLILQHFLGNPGAKFDGRKFGWLGVPTPDSGVCALTKASGIKTVEDWLASKRPIKLGGTAPGSTTDDGPRLVAAAIGLPMQLISGYKGTADIRLAADGGELDGGCWAWESIKPTWAKGLESGTVAPVLQTMFESHPELKHVPLAVKYAKTEEARELLKVANGTYGILARPYSVPPGTPKDRLEILQRAFMATIKDPALLAEAEKAKLDFKLTDGPTATKMFAEIYEMKPGIVAKLKEIILPKK